MSGLEHLSGTIALPWWTLIAALLLVLILAVLAGTRGGWQRTTGAAAQFVAVLGLLFFAWNYFDRMTTRDLAEERRAFQARLAELNARAIAPGSPLACLDALAGHALDEACENAVFANPESVAAAVSLMAARWSLLREAIAQSANDMSYDPAIADLRRSIELDRFGFAAQALAAREQCTPTACEALSLLKDPGQVAANLKDRTFDVLVGRHVAGWLGRSPVHAVASAPAQGAPSGGAAGAQAAATPATSSVNVDFPSAASIPPVSIMNNEPGMQQGGNDVESKASQPRRNASTPLPTPRAATRSGNAAPSPSAQ